METIYKKNLSELAKKIGILIKPGWKSKLAERLNQKRVGNITSWLKVGVPKDFDLILEDAGIDTAIWREIVDSRPAAAPEVSFTVPTARVVHLRTEASQPPSQNLPAETDTSGLLIKTQQILESRTIYTQALRSNIEAFHNALTCEVQLQEFRGVLDGQQEEMKNLRNEIEYIKKCQEGLKSGAS